MKNCTLLDVKQLRIFAPDRLPFTELLTSKGLNAFKGRFGWTEMGPIEGEQPELAFENGTLPGSDTVIRRLSVTPRRVLLSLDSDSSTLSRVYEAVRAFFGELDRAGAWSGCEPLILTEETTALVDLDFEWTALLAPGLVAFSQKPLLASTVQAEVAPVLAGLRLGIKLRYPRVPEHLQMHGVSLASKALVIEPRADTPLAAKRYWTQSPTDSETHVRLLEVLERNIAGKPETPEKGG